MIRYVVGAVLGALMVVGVVACTDSAQAGNEKGNGGMYQDTWHKMPDGRTVYCLYKESYIGGHSAGNAIAIDCDWAGAVVHDK